MKAYFIYQMLDESETKRSKTYSDYTAAADAQRKFLKKNKANLKFCAVKFEAA